mmetsp:Transcript_8096/g.24391  ORF Transcript_8096/g.24391 Transcript_8096/m.24391 type:complete len:362 (-) Transcript_8096:502-1587(-)
MPSVFEAAPINDQIFRFEMENELDRQFIDDEQAEGQSTDLCRFFFSKSGCKRGERCQFRHARNDKLIVCKHWLRGLCKRGVLCEFLHEFDKSKMPECYFFSKFGECSNSECIYRHVDPDKKRNECPYYARGFCKHGPKCRLRHVKKEACHDYLAGFCKNGPECVFGHARFEIPRLDDDEDGPGGIDRFGFGRPKGPVPIPKMIFGDDNQQPQDGAQFIGDENRYGSGSGNTFDGGNNSSANGGTLMGGKGGNGGGMGAFFPPHDVGPNRPGLMPFGMDAVRGPNPMSMMGGFLGLGNNLHDDSGGMHMQKGGMRRTIVCHHCHQQGHKRPECPLRAQPAASDGGLKQWHMGQSGMGKPEGQ